jgi:hypothetical protein
MLAIQVNTAEQESLHSSSQRLNRDCFLKGLSRAVGSTPSWPSVSNVLRCNLKSAADDYSLLAITSRLPVLHGCGWEKPTNGNGHANPGVKVGEWSDARTFHGLGPCEQNDREKTVSRINSKQSFWVVGQGRGP